MAFSKSAIILVWCVLCCAFVENAVGKNINNLKRVILEEIISHDEIDVLLPPNNITGGPITVEVFVHILNMGEINEEKEESKFTILLRQKWMDPRLKYENQNLFDCILVPNSAHLFWSPDFYLLGAKKSWGYDVPNSNSFARIYPNGTVISSKRITFIKDCPLNFKNFPFDFQIAQLSFSTYGSTSNNIVLRWTDDKPLTISKKIKMHLLTLQKFVLTSKIHKTLTGNYSALDVEFFLKRELSYYLIQAYIPTAMLVIVSWFSFWLNRKLLLQRLLINLLALVTLAMTVSEFNRNIPKVTYTKALDYFTGISLTFVMLSFVETVLVHVLHNETEDSEDKHTLNGDIPKKKVEKSKLQCLVAKLSEKVNYIDVGGRILYPVSYLLFCVIYFAVNIQSN